MSYAEAFRVIFDRIMQPKPRLRRVDGEWVCGSHDGKAGYGSTPATAYGAWRALAGK